MAKFPEISHSFNQHNSSFGRHHGKCNVMQKLRNSSVVYHKTKNPFREKMCLKHN